MARSCGHCGSEDCHVVETRLQPFMPFVDNVVRRRRRCKKCRRCWWTVEVPEDVALKLAAKCEDYELNVKPATFVVGASHDEDGEA